jgi:hypothetical protein
MTFAPILTTFSRSVVSDQATPVRLQHRLEQFDEKCLIGRRGNLYPMVLAGKGRQISSARLADQDRDKGVAGVSGRS